MVADALAETYDHVLFAVPALDDDRMPVAGRADLAIVIGAGETAPAYADARRATLYEAGVPEVVLFDTGSARHEPGARTAA